MIASLQPVDDPGVGARIAIVEDHELLADSLAFALGRGGFDAVVVPPTTAREVLRRIFELGPQVVLLDVHLGEFGSGVALIEPLRALNIDVICITGEDSRPVWGECIEAGASAVLSKASPFDELVTRISAAVAGEAAMSRGEREALLYAVREYRIEEQVRLEPFHRLTVRECEVLHELMAGVSADAIAERGYVSLTTVRSHIRAILLKLGVNSQLAAVAMAVRVNWVSPHRRPGCRNPVRDPQS
jgi:two-component system nitrate/nitrite response regulator NarL